MKQRKKRTITLEEFLDNQGKTAKELYAEKYKHSLSQARGYDNDEELIEKLNIRTGNYSLRTRIAKNPWLGRGVASKATKWLFKEVFTNPREYRYDKQLLYQSGLFSFEYKNPKYKGTSVLPWFDMYPLVVSLGPVTTNYGVRNIGFNLHLLPPRIRVVVLCGIFEMYKKLYRYQIFYKQEKPIQIKYQAIVKAFDKYGVRFAIRMYIPARMNKIVRFPLKTWYKAIFVPSRGYDSIRAEKLIKEWRAFNRKNGYSISPRLDWKKHI